MYRASMFMAMFLLSAATATGDVNLRTDREDGFDELFDGKDLTGWVVEGTAEYKTDDGAAPVWRAEDGKIVCAGRGFGFLRYDRKVSDFTLALEFRTPPRTNSGIGIRHVKYTGKAESRPSYSGYEIQILDDAGKEPSKSSSGSLYRYLAPRASAMKAAGEWNKMLVECRGPRIKITLNDKVLHDIDQSAVAEIAKKPLSGYFSLQNHGGKIEFRHIRLKESKS